MKLMQWQCRFIHFGKPLYVRRQANYDFEELEEYMHGRKNSERRDSVTKDILNERKKHQSRFSSIKLDRNIHNYVESIGLGTRKRKNKDVDRHSTFGASHVGAGGFANHLTSAAGDWPLFHHILPEVAFGGHTNSGKSTLVNIVAGFASRKGPAKVSERAGWTDQICFYQLGKRPPVLVLADMPGYGHAVASKLALSQWNAMIKDYVSNRSVLSLCCILVDCTRGLCTQDKRLIKLLRKHGIEWRIILTKCDLLSAEEIAQSMTIVQSDLIELLTSSEKSKKEKSSLITTNTLADHVDELNTDIPPDLSNSTTGLNGTLSADRKTHDEVLELPRTEYDPSLNLFTADESTSTAVCENEDDIEWGDLYDDDVASVLSSSQSVSFEKIAENESNADDAQGCMNLTDDGVRDTDSSDREPNKVHHQPLPLPLYNEKEFESTNEITDEILNGRIIPVSSSTGAGIKQLWSTLTTIAHLHSIPPALRKNKSVVNEKINSNDFIVKEHYLANLLRRQSQQPETALTSRNRPAPPRPALVKGHNFNFK